MSVVAPESETASEPETDTASNSDATATLDVNVVFEQASSLIDLSHPGTTLSPLEPSTTEPSRDATILVGSGDLATMILLVDGASEAEALAIPDVIAALAERLSETMSLETHTLDEATDAQIKALSEATTFRTSLTAPEAALGEFRFAVGTIEVPETHQEAPSAEEPSDSATPENKGNGVPEQETADETAAPDASALAERLPNLAAVDMNVSVELGRVKLPIRELLGLGAGSVIRLGTPVGESFDILVNGKAAARGDLVVVGGRLAVRIRELLGVDA